MATRSAVGQHKAPSTDAELMQAMADRQPWALAELYDRYATVLYSLAYKILGDAAPAQDVVQEAFLAAWRKADLYNQRRGVVGTWLTVMCRNLAIDHYRAKMRLASRKVELDKIGDFLMEHGDDPADTAIAAEDGKMLRLALEQLPPEQKHVIELAYFRGMSQSEIAAATNTPLGTVKTRIRQAMMKLRDQLVQPSESAS